MAIIDGNIQEIVGRVRFLPPDFKINMHHTPAWGNNPMMQRYIYHFVGQTKQYLD